MSLATLTQFLDGKHVPYIVTSHSSAYTAQAVAALAHISGNRLAKTVIVRIDGELAMAIVPASRHVDLLKLKEVTGARTIELAPERIFSGRFPECETGAMPPFGNLYGMKVYTDVSLSNDQEIIFNAGSHRDLIRMAWKDFATLATPRIAEFATGQVRRRLQ
ncbi:MAG: YbaK/EbsC family protein [Acidobacteria bacterium]|jgi:Ala-tRNA(Pro) deacylase|nr:YbaK/EbsC family protein [Acidobacteriota bacterium]